MIHYLLLLALIGYASADTLNPAHCMAYMNMEDCSGYTIKITADAELYVTFTGTTGWIDGKYSNFNSRVYAIPWEEQKLTVKLCNYGNNTINYEFSVDTGGFVFDLLELLFGNFLITILIIVVITALCCTASFSLMAFVEICCGRGVDGVEKQAVSAVSSQQQVQPQQPRQVQPQQLQQANEVVVEIDRRVASPASGNITVDDIICAVPSNRTSTDGQYIEMSELK